ncbi:MAG: hypothetical protein E7514_07975 [Ruminococcaceae bacterium]|nr:hypothetical protein [Oscillospiraceae bacterium]
MLLLLVILKIKQQLVDNENLAFTQIIEAFDHDISPKSIPTRLITIGLKSFRFGEITSYNSLGRPVRDYDAAVKIRVMVPYQIGNHVAYQTVGEIFESLIYHEPANLGFTIVNAEVNEPKYERCTESLAVDVIVNVKGSYSDVTPV